MWSGVKPQAVLLGNELIGESAEGDAVGVVGDDVWACTVSYLKSSCWDTSVELSHHISTITRTTRTSSDGDEGT